MVRRPPPREPPPGQIFALDGEHVATLRHGITDWCAHCERPLERLAHGAYRACCAGLAYWSLWPPHPRDELLFGAHAARGTQTGALVYRYARAELGTRTL